MLDEHLLDGGDGEIGIERLPAGATKPSKASAKTLFTFFSARTIAVICLPISGSLSLNSATAFSHSSKAGPDVIKPRRGLTNSARATAQNRINSKHVDFVLCEVATRNVVCAIELDDASHDRASRKARDEFVVAALAAARVPFARIRAQKSYAPEEVRHQVLAALTSAVSASGAKETSSRLAACVTQAGGGPSRVKRRRYGRIGRWALSCSLQRMGLPLTQYDRGSRVGWTKPAG